jgi:hypothetical protein
MDFIYVYISHRSAQEDSQTKTKNKKPQKDLRLCCTTHRTSRWNTGSVTVGDLFSNAMSQEQGNIENVNR